MAQAATTSDTDELLSQLAASEIDRLLSEADTPPAPREDANPAESATINAAIAEAIPTDPSQPTTEGSERAALLQAAGFDSPTPDETAAANTPAVEEERNALLHAAGFESPEEMGLHPKPSEPSHIESPGHENSGDTPLYLKPLVWINAPINSSPELVRQIMGKVGIVTLLNALVVLTYIIFFRKH